MYDGYKAADRTVDTIESVVEASKAVKKGKDALKISKAVENSAEVKSITKKAEDLIQSITSSTKKLSTKTNDATAAIKKAKQAKNAKAKSNLLESTKKIDNDRVENIIEISISKSKYPQSTKHIQDAIQSGQPDILTINRDGAKANRKASLAGIDKVKGYDLDEYPPAMFKEGGKVQVFVLFYLLIIVVPGL